MDTSMANHMAEARHLLSALRQEAKAFQGDVRPVDYPSGRAIINGSPALQVATVRVIMSDGGQRDWRRSVLSPLLRRDLPFAAEDLEHIATVAYGAGEWAGRWEAVLRLIERFSSQYGLTPGLRGTVQRMHDSLPEYMAAERKLKSLAADILSMTKTDMPISGEVWADAAVADLDGMESAQRVAWEKLFAHAATASTGKPSSKWNKDVQKLIDTLGSDEFARRVSDWFLLVTLPPLRNSGAIRAEGEGYVIVAHPAEPRVNEKNVDLLKGLAWCCAGRDEPELARALGHLADAAFHKVPGVGPWASRAGNAAIYALGQMTCAPEAVGQLSSLRAKMRDRSALKAIAAAIEQVAARSGMATDDLEDLAVPTGGLDVYGTRRVMFGEDGSALLALHPLTGHVSVQWFVADGKERKAVPTAVKKNYAPDVKALKVAEEEIKQALSAQSARLDRALLDERAWTVADWQARFLSHPILGNLARRLVWVTSPQAAPPAPQFWGEKSLQPVSDSSILPEQMQGKDSNRKLPPGIVVGGAFPESALVRLWHPITGTPVEVMQWRDKLTDAGIVQPFKQAHREVYLLTDAERSTRTYSNRFAAHVIKQHQFNSLCALRGWKNKLRLMVDDSYPPATRELPRHNLRAEFWIEGIGDDYGTDTNETGTYLRLSTDQVRFYALAAPANNAHASGGGYSTAWRQTPVDPLPLDSVPPLVLSEILRDVDLFVGVASVGNDPTWADGGPAGRFRDYWQDYSFGDLGETAKTRRAVLERLLPRLKIAARTELTDKFLRVRGELRTYKIHLGSGNILMEPNDQYLCIVPSSREGGAGDVFLPFEGDRTLAIILSKAFLLAGDTRITDPTITRQIR